MLLLLRSVAEAAAVAALYRALRAEASHYAPRLVLVGSGGGGGGGCAAVRRAVGGDVAMCDDATAVHVLGGSPNDGGCDLTGLDELLRAAQPVMLLLLRKPTEAAAAGGAAAGGAAAAPGGEAAGDEECPYT